MSKNVFLKISIISITLLLAIGLLICSNTMANEWEWGSQNYGGWGSFNSGSSWTSWFGGKYSNPKSSSKKKKEKKKKKKKKWVGWNNDCWEEFIEKLKEKYPNLEGIEWDDYENWNKADWDALREALEEVRVEESLENFIEDINEIFDEYDNYDWETFNTNFFAFIDIADDDPTTDIELTWAGFVAIYGCFDTANNDSQLIECWKDYVIWTDDQWADFRSIYCEYSKYEWEQFNKELQERLEDYYDELANWEDWRDWTDEEWESYLDKYSDFITISSTGSDSSFAGQAGYSYNSPDWFGFGSFNEYDFGSLCGYSYSSPACYGFGGSGGYGFGSFFGGPGGYSYGSPARFGFSGFNSYGFGSRGYGYSGQGRYGFPGGYGFSGFGGGYGFPGYGYGGSWGNNDWWW